MKSGSAAAFGLARRVVFFAVAAFVVLRPVRALLDGPRARLSALVPRARDRPADQHEQDRRKQLEHATARADDGCLRAFPGGVE